MNFKSLKAKILLLSLGCLVVLGVSAQILVARLTDEARAEKVSTYGSYASNLQAAIAAQFFERYGDVQAFAANPGLLAADRAEIVSHLNNYVRLYGIYDLILVVDLNGRVVAVNDVNPAGEKLDVSRAYAKTYRDAEWFKATAAGKFTEDKERGFVGTYVEDAHADPIVADVYKRDSFGNSFSAPIKDRSGRTIGVLTNRAGFRWVEGEFVNYYESLKRAGATTSELTLLNKDGAVIVDYDPTRDQDTAVHRNPEVIGKLNLFQAKLEFTDDLKAGKPGSNLSIHKRKGTEHVTGYSPINSNKFIPATGWSVVVRASSDELFADLRHAELIFRITFGVILVLSIVFSLLFANNISAKIIHVSDRLGAGTREVSFSSTSLAEASHELSASASEQAAALQETVASLDEVNAMVGKNTENAQKTKEGSEQSKTAAIEGKQAVTDMIQSINEIQASNDEIAIQMEKSNAEISEIVQVINEIGAKTKVINDIVFQTKLLSFNASVEAARAGEHGKGFAVVAEEVGNLAEMSGNSAKEISTLLAESTAKVQRIVEETKSNVASLVEKGKHRVEAGIQNANRCEATLEQIVEKVSQMNVMIEEIATASKEQQEGVSEIAKAMNQLDQVTQQNASVSEQCSRSSATLKNQAVDLRSGLDELIFLVRGTNVNAEARDTPVTQAKVPTLVPKSQVATSRPKSGKVPDTSSGATTPTADSGIPKADDSRFEDVA